MMNLLELIKPGDHLKAGEHFNAVATKGKAGGDPAFIKKDGSLHYWTVNAVKLSENRFLGFVTDFTERKRAEEALRKSEATLNALFGAMTEMVTNEQGEAIDYRIIECNRAFGAVTGIPKDDAVGKLTTEVYQTEAAPYLEEYSRVALTGETYEFTSYYPPMDKYFMISVVSPQPGQFATISTDVKAIKQLQTLVSAKNKELENYLYVASHDLSAPLVNIQGFSQYLRKQTEAIANVLSESSVDAESRQKLEQLTKEEIPESLEFILTNATKMDTLINGLLKISRTGRTSMNVQQIEVLTRLKNNDVLKEVAVMMLTTTDDPREVEQCYQLGCNAYITKPVEFGTFAEVLKRLGLFIQIIKI